MGAEEDDLGVIALEVFFLALHTGHLAGLLLVCPEVRGQGRAQLAAQEVPYHAVQVDISIHESAP
jgi:hypothetical protein